MSAPEIDPVEVVSTKRPTRVTQTDPRVSDRLTRRPIGSRVGQRSVIDFGGGVGRRVRAELCRRCGRPYLTGLDNDRVALTARADPYPLNALGEAVALLTGRATFDLHRVGGAYVLDHRGPEIITAHPAGSVQFVDTLAAHECTAAEPPAEYRVISKLHADRIERTDNAECPF